MKSAVLFTFIAAGQQALAGRESRAALDSLQVTHIGDVRGHLHLPKTSGGFEITWQSSDTETISNSGVVSRKDTNSTVILTATIEDSDGKEERDFEALVHHKARIDPLEAYAFSYFTGDSLEGENIFFAASIGNDALQWQELNNGEPVITSSEGTGGLRDPFIIRSPEGDTFFMIATDLSIGSGTSWGDAVRHGSHYLEIWESNDLINWSEQRHVKVSPSNAGNTWAPEAFYDPAIEAYVLFWASSLYDDPEHESETYHRMMYCTTRDFVTFSEAEVWQDVNDSRIDTTVISQDGTFYRFTKDEGQATGCTDIIQESSDTLLDQAESWDFIASCIGRDAELGAVEGPTIFKANDGDVHGSKFYLFVDEYSGRGYVPLESEDLDSGVWTLSPSYDLPSSPRHGTVIPVTAAEHEALVAALGAAPEKRQAEDETHETEMRNPVLPGLWADPNIIAIGSTYYIFATTDGFEGWSGTQFYWWKSDDLVNWTRGEEPFLDLDPETDEVPWAVGNAWAPGYAARDGKFFFYFSGHNPDLDAKSIGVAVADHPEGPYQAEQEPMILGVESEGAVSGQTIDPAIFEDPESGTWYIYWGNGVPIVAELNDDMISTKEGSFIELEGLVDFREGLFLNYREGVYHLTYSIDDTGSEDYRVGYATADSPIGPWTYQGVIVEKDPSQGILGTGHNSVLNVPGTDDWYMVYHRFAIPDGGGFYRETAIDRLDVDPETGLFLPVQVTLEGVGEQEIEM